MWKIFKLADIFSICSTSSGIDKNKLDLSGGNFPYITRTDRNNGIQDFICEQTNYKINSGNCITVGLDTQTAFYQPTAFYTGQNIQILINEQLNLHIALFMLPCIKNTLSIFSWGGNGATLTRLRRSKILLPVNDNGEPDFEYMETYIRLIEEEILQKYRNYIAEFKAWGGVVTLNKKIWRPFFIKDVAEIISGRDIYEDERKSGKNPYIGSSAQNNGICHFISNENETLEENCISVNRNGSVGYAFYHPYAALYSNDCRKLRPRVSNEYVSLFIAHQITAQKEKYNYGYKMGTARLQRQKIMLPVNETTDEPDFDYMGKLIRIYEKNSVERYLNYINGEI